VRRIVGVLTSAVLALSLSCAAARADRLSLAAPRLDLASQLMLRLFGETADATASFSAASGDRSSESPLHELAFRVPAPVTTGLAGVPPTEIEQRRIALASLPALGASFLARAVDAGLISADVRFAATAQTPQRLAQPIDGENALYTAAYHPVAPLPSISPDPGTLAFDSTLPESSSAVQTLAPPFALGSENRAPKNSLSLTLSGVYQQAAPDQPASLPYSTLAAPTWQLPAASATVGAPSFSASNRFSLGAALAVPVFHGLTLNLNYDARRAYGDNALPGVQDLDAANNSYAGRLTYDIPSTSSSLSISAYQRFGESVLPVNGFTQTGEDVNFTVKF
jgi:hypothetical protein